MLSDNYSMLAMASKSLSPSKHPMQTRDFLPSACGVWTLHFNSSFNQMGFPRPVQEVPATPVTVGRLQKAEAQPCLRFMPEMKDQPLDSIPVS